MAIITAQDRTAILDAATRLLNDRCSEADVRRTMETSSGYDPGLWRQLSEMGITGLIIDEARGGVGAGPVELELVMEAVGAALLCSPLLASGVIAAALLGALPDATAGNRLLPGVADGTRIATVALTGDAGTWTPEGVAVSAVGDRLRGHASYVLHGQNADVLLVMARTDGGMAIFEVDPRGPGVVVSPLPTFDHTQRMARITFDDATGVLIGDTGEAWPAAKVALNWALVALAGEQAGGARKVLQFTVDYAKNRIQFGRAIGSFQAIKHMAADLLLETESAVSAARHAAASLAEGASDAQAWIELAAFACADAFSTTTATAIQMHGGIAFTWIHPAHLYLRRARADAQLFGAPAQHRERYLTELGA